MNITKLGWLNIINKPLNTILSLLLMTLGVGIISLLFLLNDKIEQQLNNNLKGVDMVVGAKGSPLQLILSSVYHIDNPTGNISLKEANDIKKNPMIKSQTIPIQAAFQDKLTATVRVATGPIMNPDIQSRSTVVNALTPVSLHQSGVLGKILRRVFRSRV